MPNPIGDRKDTFDRSLCKYRIKTILTYYVTHGVNVPKYHLPRVLRLVRLASGTLTYYANEVNLTLFRISE